LDSGLLAVKWSLGPGILQLFRRVALDGEENAPRPVSGLQVSLLEVQRE
jgi:hypothetical protein